MPTRATRVRNGKLREPGCRNRPLSERQKRRNQRIAQVRARVAHPFGAIAQMGGKLIRIIGQARANFAMTLMAPAITRSGWFT